MTGFDALGLAALTVALGLLIVNICIIRIKNFDQKEMKAYGEELDRREVQLELREKQLEDRINEFNKKAREIKYLEGKKELEESYNKRKKNAQKKS